MDTVGGTILVAVILAAIVAAIIYKLVRIRNRAKALAVAAAAVVQILPAVTDHDKTVINFGEVI